MGAYYISMLQKLSDAVIKMLIKMLFDSMWVLKLCCHIDAIMRFR